jgi:hypothetical protein
VPRHVARLVTRLVAPLVVDYSSSTTSPSSRVRVPRHVARLVAPLVVDYSASRSLVVDYSVRRDFVLRQHWLYFEYAAHRHDVVFRSHRVDHSSRLVFQLVEKGSHAPNN